MPAKSKAQRRLFALALQYKRGDIPKEEVSDEVIELSKLPEKTLEDYAKTKEENLPDKVEENFRGLEPSSGTAAGRAGGGFPFGHEFGSAARQADAEFGYIKKDKAEDEIEKEVEAKKKAKKNNSGRAKSFEEFTNQSQTLQEMDGAVAASPTNTPGMGNATPGEVGGAAGSGDKWDYDDEEDEKKKNRRAKSRTDWKRWKDKKAKSEKKNKSKGKPEVQRPAWELGGRLPTPVVNTVK